MVLCPYATSNNQLTSVKSFLGWQPCKVAQSKLLFQTDSGLCGLFADKMQYLMLGLIVGCERVMAVLNIHCYWILLMGCQAQLNMKFSSLLRFICN
jgi:hypothetical protein